MDEHRSLCLIFLVLDGWISLEFRILKDLRGRCGISGEALSSKTELALKFLKELHLLQPGVISHGLFFNLSATSLGCLSSTQLLLLYSFHEIFHHILFAWILPSSYYQSVLRLLLRLC